MLSYAPLPPPPPDVPVSKSVRKIEKAVAKRYETDEIMSFALWIILSIFTLGIAAVIAMYKLINRRDRHFKRQRKLEKGLVKYLGKNPVMAKYVPQLKMTLKGAKKQERERGAVKYVMVMAVFAVIAVGIVVYGLIDDRFEEWTGVDDIDWVYLAVMIGVASGALIVSLYIMYFLTEDAYRHDMRQLRFFGAIGNAFAERRTPIPPIYYRIPKRSFGLYIVLSILTVGIFAIYWFYVIFKDMNEHFRVQWMWEDMLLMQMMSGTPAPMGTMAHAPPPPPPPKHLPNPDYMMK